MVIINFMNKHPRLIIAALKGGSGKTILSIGIARLWKKQGLKVRAFKKGPDYIDAGWLACASGNPCYNLDPFLIGKEHLLSSFVSHSSCSDVSVIEGNRGIFDGMDEDGTYSTAELSKSLKAPVILIIDCNKATRTIAALINGVKDFDRGLELKGVVLNQIAGNRHESVIRRSIEKYSGIPVLGAIPRLDKDIFPERHMGLTPFHEHPEVESAIEGASGIVGKYVDSGMLLMIAREAGDLEDIEGFSVSRQDTAAGITSPLTPHTPSLRIGVVRDSAFQFYYEENLEELKKHSVDIIEISALNEKELPDLDALYIGGGFPETHAIALAGNAGFRNSLKAAIEKGLPVYAECGGLMYLGEALLLDGRTYPMAGIFPLTFSLEKRPQAHGYSVVEVIAGNPYFRNGTLLRGHEFHYSRAMDFDGDKTEFSFAFRIKRGRGLHNGMDGICYRNVLATYTHLHALGAMEWVDGMLRAASEYKKFRTNNKQ